MSPRGSTSSVTQITSAAIIMSKGPVRREVEVLYKHQTKVLSGTKKYMLYLDFQSKGTTFTFSLSPFNLTLFSRAGQALIRVSIQIYIGNVNKVRQAM